MHQVSLCFLFFGFFFFMKLMTAEASSLCSENEVRLNDKCRCLPPKVKVAGSCQVSCPSSTFLDLTKHSCEPCDSTCSQCWGPSPNQCLSCTSSLLYNPFLGTCEATCQQGVDGGRGVCVGNTASCAGLVADTPFISSSSKECMSVCNQPYDLLGSSLDPYNLCGFGQCHQSCGINPQTRKRQCLGKWQAGSCLACDKSNGGVQVQLGVTSNGQPIYDCVRQPPTNSYYSSETDTYFMCSPQCNGCSGSPDNCLKCAQKNWVLLSDGSCKFECPSGTFPQGDNKICLSPSAGTDPELISSIVSYHEAGGAMVSAGTASLQILSPGSPSIVSTVLLVNLLQYLKYLSINYPPNLAAIFKGQTHDAGSINFGPLFPDYLKDDSKEYQAQTRFALFDLNGLFLVNFWRGILTSCILAGATVLVSFTHKILLRNEKLRPIGEKLKNLLIWNFLITFILSNLGSVSIYAIIEYQILNLDSAFSVISFLFNLVFVIGSTLLLAYIPKKLYNLRKEHKDKTFEEKIKNNDNIRVLFEKLKNKYFLQELVLFVIGVRAILSNLVVSAIDSPIAQCSLLLIISIIMIAYFCSLRPFQGIVENIEVLGYEIIMAAVNISCLYLSTLESTEQYEAEDAGNFIIVCNIIMLSFSLIMCVLKIGVQGAKVIKERATQKKAKQVGSEISSRQDIPKLDEKTATNNFITHDKEGLIPKTKKGEFISTLNEIDPLPSMVDRDKDSHIAINSQLTFRPNGDDSKVLVAMEKPEKKSKYGKKILPSIVGLSQVSIPKLPASELDLKNEKVLS